MISSTTASPRTARRVAAAAAYGALLLLGIGLGVLAVAGSSLLGAGGRGGIIAGVVLLILAATPMLLRLRVDYLDAPGLYALAAIMFFGVTSLAWLGTPYAPGPGLSRGDVAQALLVVALGLAVFGVGARLMGPPRPVANVSFERSRGPSRTALLVAYGFALVGVVIGLALHVYSYLASPAASAQLSGVLEVLNFLGDLGGIVVVITALTYFSTGDRSLRAPLIVFVSIQTVFGVVSGVKGTTIEAIAFVLLAYIACRRRVPWKTIVVVIVLALGVLVPLNTVYREALRSGSQNASAALNQAISSPYAPTTSPTDPVTFLLTRFRSIDNVALIVSQTPSLYPFAGGNTYYELPAIALVPRAIWPTKPALTTGADFSQTYWQIPSFLRTSTPLTQVGDLYRNFGLWGVILGTLLWGVVIGGWQRLRQRWTSPLFACVFLYSVLYYVTYVESDLPELLATAAKILPLVGLVAWLLLPRQEGQPGYRKLLGLDRGHLSLSRRATPQSIRDAV